MTAPKPSIQSRLAELSDVTRCRLLVALERRELTVGELCQALVLPQSTVSRHLRILSDDGWVVSRAEGASRWYTKVQIVDDEGEALWALVRRSLIETTAIRQDIERVEATIALRRSRSEEFFANAATEWDAMRAAMFGARADLVATLALLDPHLEVGDLGCGTGVLSAALAPHVRAVHAIDLSPEMLAAAQARVSNYTNVTVRSGSLESLPLADSSLDVAIMVLVLHHLVQPQAALAEARRVVRKGGRILIADMRAHSREEYRQQMGHVWLGFEESTLRSWCTDAGFCDVRYTALSIDATVAGPALFTLVAQ